MSFPLAYKDDHTLHPLEWHRRALAWCSQMRQNHPVVYSQEYGWLVFGYQSAQQVRSAPEVFSVEFQQEGSVALPGFTGMDPPQHQRMRMLVTAAFSAGAISRLVPFIEATASDLLAQIDARGQGELIEAFAVPLPAIVVAELLGLPHEDWPRVKTWTDMLVGISARQDEVQQELERYFLDVVAWRRRHTGRDLLSQLLLARVEGRPLSREELFAFFVVFLVTGHVNFAYVLGNALLCLDLFPGELARLRAHPDLVPGAFEEVLRYMSSERVLTHELPGCRIATRDVWLEGRHIRKGEIVRPVIFSANFDERQFTDPERFLIARSPNHHQALGHGIHYCLGARLARLEGCIVLRELLQRFRAWEIVDREHLEQVDSEIFFGVKRLPMRFQRA